MLASSRSDIGLGVSSFQSTFEFDVRPFRQPERRLCEVQQTTGNNRPVQGPAHAVRLHTHQHHPDNISQRVRRRLQPDRNQRRCYFRFGSHSRDIVLFRIQPGKRKLCQLRAGHNRPNSAQQYLPPRAEPLERPAQLPVRRQQFLNGVSSQCEFRIQHRQQLRTGLGAWSDHNKIRLHLRPVRHLASLHLRQLQRQTR